MGSTGASATYHAYGDLIRTPSIHPLIRSCSIKQNNLCNKRSRPISDKDFDDEKSGGSLVRFDLSIGCNKV
ncbi:hypothetical protein GCK72_024816 [Caenorhabditis remanei]|uniref:Uncharacterized protein n=1 Tax=Caenorhabditis remanei TaxID=31234 RepID=A0A6A5G1D3_CAERE|nr:hypothetical protein GCK72_024816 [Caenorhabditis remanei]KAF1748349.1 hypothetical protein GCK72_024816 [Caenorhabditis remanei]